MACSRISQVHLPVHRRWHGHCPDPVCPVLSGTVTNNGAIIEAELSFTQFPEVGSVTTYDSTSFCPDSASTATSIASGKKTESGVINMCPWTRDVPYETIAEKLHKQKATRLALFPR